MRFLDRGERGNWFAIAVLAVAFMGSPQVAPAGEGAAEPAEQAQRFAERFLAGEFDAIEGEMSAEMRAAFPPETQAQARAAMLQQFGDVKAVGAAWQEDTVEGYLRYRVPVDFARTRGDLRIVIDAEGKVAGFFQVPHLPDPALAEAAEPSPGIAGHWEGTIEIAGSPLAIVIDLTFSGGSWSGSCDIPSQGAKGLPLGDFAIAADAVGFSLLGIPGNPTFRGKLDGGKITGTFSQAGGEFPFTLGREELPQPGRPQEPEPPFPYRSEDLTFSSGEVTLAGTLTLPPGEGPFPAALLVTGSGPQNRNEEVFDHRPFLVLADHLTRAGIAVLRVDDRGVGGSTGSLATVTTADLVGDARAGVDYLRGREEIDAARVGLIGHSEGGIIAPMVAVKSGKAAFVVMLAGPAVPGDQLITLQLERIYRAAGVDEETVKRIRAAQVELLAAIRADAGEEAIRARLRELVRIQLEASSGTAPDEETLAAALAQNADVASPWFRFFLDHDPRPTLRKLDLPVLALFGELDLQVPADQNLPEARKALEESGNGDVTVESLPALNHLFQTARTGSPDEYYGIEETFSPVALRRITDWILARFVRLDEAA